MIDLIWHRTLNSKGVLLDWALNDKLHEMLDKTNSENLKYICMENGIPRAGAKYEVAMKIRKTVYAWQDQQKKKKPAAPSPEKSVSSSSGGGPAEE